MFKKVLSAMLVLLLAVIACNLPTSGGAPTGGAGAVLTAAAQTIQVQAALLTPQTAAATQPPPLETAPPGQPNPIPPALPSPTNTSIPCNLASFVADVSYPDGTEVEVNKAFTKTWKLKNKGSCTWTSGYQLVFDSGGAMGGPASQVLTSGTVAPDQTLDVSVNLVAPAAPGTYRGNWKIREPGGTTFSLSTGPFWVQIKAVAAVTQPSGSLPGWPTKRKGDKGAEVMALQYLLRSYGESLAVDSIFGNETLSVVKSFQKQYGLQVDGIVGPKTWSKLVQGRQVATGAKGDAVQAVQYLLLTKYSYSIAVDGIFGPKTRDVVLDFQTKKGLLVDGIVVPWSAFIASCINL